MDEKFINNCQGQFNNEKITIYSQLDGQRTRGQRPHLCKLCELCVNGIQFRLNGINIIKDYFMDKQLVYMSKVISKICFCVWLF